MTIHLSYLQSSPIINPQLAVPMDLLSLIAAISITASPARAHSSPPSLRTEHREALGRVIIWESHHEMETSYVFCFHKFIYLVSAIRRKYMEAVWCTSENVKQFT